MINFLIEGNLVTKKEIIVIAFIVEKWVKILLDMIVKIQDLGEKMLNLRNIKIKIVINLKDFNKLL